MEYLHGAAVQTQILAGIIGLILLGLFGGPSIWAWIRGLYVDAVLDLRVWRAMCRLRARYRSVAEETEERGKE